MVIFINHLVFVKQKNLLYTISINLNAINFIILFVVITFCVVLKAQMFIILQKSVYKI